MRMSTTRSSVVAIKTSSADELMTRIIWLAAPAVVIHCPEPHDFTGRNAIHGSKPYGLQSMTVNPMKSLASTRKSMAPNTMNSKTKLQSMRYEFSTVHDEYCDA